MKFIGTGTDPDGQYPKGWVVDEPAGSDTADNLLAKGYVRIPDYAKEDSSGHEVVDPSSMSNYALAQAAIRGDVLDAPVDKAAVERFVESGLDPHAVIASHNGAPQASPGEAQDASVKAPGQQSGPGDRVVETDAAAQAARHGDSS